VNSSPTHDALVSLGYRLVENKWAEHGRRTYVYDDEAARAHIKSPGDALQKAGWAIDQNKLRSFCHPSANEVIEAEPGGSDTSGHFLHHMKA
jgi:hypothetical protein